MHCRAHDIYILRGEVRLCVTHKHIPIARTHNDHAAAPTCTYMVWVRDGCFASDDIDRCLEH